jgi:hypothetical protein
MPSPPLVAVADAANPQLRAAGSLDNSASISPAGQFLAWDEGRCIRFGSPASRTTTPRGVRLVCPTSGGVAYFAPSVGVGLDGSLRAAWLAFAGGQVSLVVREIQYQADVVVVNAVDPIWAMVQGETVYWAQVTESGLDVYGLDMSTASYRLD